MMLFTPQPYLYRQPSVRSRSMFEPQDDFYSSPYHHPNHYAYRPSYEELQEARAREYHRRRQEAEQAELARRAAISERYRHRQLLEQQRERERQQKLRYLAELERKKYLDALLRSQRFGAYGGHPWYDDFSEDEEEDVFHHPVRETAIPSVPPSASVPSQVPAPIDASSKPTRSKPTLEQQHEAASLIQSFYRATLTRRKALATLSSIRSSFNDLTSSFTFPSSPSFDQVPSTTESTRTYKLSYNSINAPIHAYEDSLVRLFSKLDGVESNGDLRVRKARKKLARDIEHALEELDRRKEEAAEAYRARLPVQVQVRMEEAGASGSSSNLAAPLPADDTLEIATTEREDEPSQEDTEMHIEVNHPESTSLPAPSTISPQVTRSESTPPSPALPSTLDSEMHIEVHPGSSSPQASSPHPALAAISPQPAIDILQPISEDPHHSPSQPEPEPEPEAGWALITSEDLNNGPSDDESDPEPDLRGLFDL